jgi:CheY-like chemotaxis protein
MIEPKRVMLVEDDEADVKLILRALAQQHLADEVFVLEDGAEALDYLFREGEFAGRADGDPVLVLLDIKMPRVDGLEVLRRMKAKERLRMIPVVMLTSSRQEGDLLASYQLGVHAYVVKPVEFAEFVEAVKLLGIFWLLVNEPQPGALPKLASPGTQTGEV